MDIRKKSHIKVSNYTPARVAVESRRRGYLFDACIDGIPTFELMDFEEIEFINSKSPVFRNGTLRFDAEDEKAIFNELKYPNWKDTVLTEADIVDIITNPTFENQQRVVNTIDLMSVERMRGYVTAMLNSGDERVSAKMADIIKARCNELAHNITASRIVAKQQHNQSADVAALLARIEALEKQNAELAKPKKTTTRKPTTSSRPKPKTETVATAAE